MAHEEDIKAIDLHAFGDAKQKGIYTAAYAIFFSRVQRQSSLDHFEVVLVKERFIDTKARVGVRAHVSKPTA